MSLTSAFNNASSGLTVALKAAGVVSSNLANALSENYGRRELTVMPLTEGGSVASRIVRQVDERSMAQIRLSSSETAGLSTSLFALRDIDRLFGGADDPGSLFAVASKFENSLIELSSQPDATVRRERMLFSAETLAEKITSISKGIESIRTDAEKEIAKTVESLNHYLSGISDLNGAIAKSHGQNTASLEDARQSLIDKLSEIVPVKSVPRDHGRIALMTPKGQFLLDQSAALFSFEGRGLIANHQTIEAGDLELPRLNGSVFKAPETGQLSALLDVRDKTGPSALSQLDGITTELVIRTNSPAGNHSVFGFSDDHDNASDLTVLPSATKVDPVEMLTSLSGAEGGSSFFEIVGDLSSTWSSRIWREEEMMVSASAEYEALVEQNSSGTVDTDQELQTLIRIEKSYAANAKALQVVGEMLDDLLRIG